MEKKTEIPNEMVELLLTWYEKNKRDLPWRRNTEPYRIWVSEIMLQQTRVEAGKEYYLRFLKELPRIEDLANVRDEVLMKLWEGLGYYNRARNLKKAAGIVVEQYSGQLPGSYEKLLLLPGIGPYTAGAIASIAFGEPVPSVDGNVLRVLMRLLARYDDISKEKVKQLVKEMLIEVIPQDRPGQFNQSLMELGATVCIPNGAPKCEACPLAEICLAYRQGIAMELPIKQAKKARRVEEKTIFIIKDTKGRVLLRKRESKGLLAGLWELPWVESQLSAKSAQEFLKQEGIRCLKMEEAGEAKHIFSHIEWRMIGYSVLAEFSEKEELKLCQGTVVAEEEELYLRDVEPENSLWQLAGPEDLKQKIALPSAFKAYRGQC